MNLGDKLEEQARSRADTVAYSFTDSNHDRVSVTYSELWATVGSMAEFLQGISTTGDRVVILCNPSMAYLYSFYATVAAGLVAVPAYPIAATQHADRAKKIVEDCQPRIVLSDTDYPDNGSALGMTADVRWVNVAALLASDPEPATESWTRPDLPSESLAFLQYTSGSTGAPKGVMVNHANLLHNAESARLTFDFSTASIMVSWLPPFHDMGLIGCIITPMVVGFPCHLMAPSTFLRRPLRWLELISELRATDSTAPNFAYRLCAERADAANLDTLDLSSWTKAMNGAEPVSVDALKRFATAYSGTGFDPASYRPCYGMAEATLLISGRHSGQTTPRSASPASTEAEGTFVSCGSPEPEADIKIVDPKTHVPVPEGHEGEIWVSSPSVAQGYWNNSAATAETFAASTRDGQGPYLRTGDLGFLTGGELFVSGRLKDILVINGRNVYPQDLEDAVRGASPAFTGRTAAAFESHGRIVVAVEAVAGTKSPVDELHRTARAASSTLAKELQVPAPLVVVLRRGTLTTTSSGKIQRSATRTAWAEHSLADREITRSDTAPGDQPPSPAEAPGPATAAAIPYAVVLRELFKISGVPAGLSPHTFLSDLHLDSVKVAALATAIEDATGIRVPLSLAWEVDTVDSFASAVANLAARPATETPAPALPRANGQARGVLLTGAACRLPGGSVGADQYWETILAGQPLTAKAPDGTARTGFRRAATTPELAGFTPEIFGLGEAEAQAMDPRQRLSLTLAWEALEDAGLDPRSMRGQRIGVYVGGSDGEFVGTRPRGSGDEGPAGYRTTGSAGSMLANRISYVLGLRGPSMVVDSACSSSLVAVHLALQALREGEVDIALVGGAHALLDGEVSDLLAEAGMLSPSGTVSTFDQSADGYVRGEGGVMLVFEASDVRPGPRPAPYCRVLGSAVNQDGRSNGLTAPSGVAQQDVVRRALKAAGRAPDDIGYIEAHGTGTPLGDPVEVHALGRVFGPIGANTPLWLGAAKAQIGHLEAAAGVAGLLRAALVVRSGIIPTQPSFERPSERIDWSGSRLRVPTEAAGWLGTPRTAGVSSFGFGGTNAHVILESVDDQPLTGADRQASSPVLVRFSAQSEAMLETQCTQILDGPATTEPAAAVAAATAQSRASGPARRWTVADPTEDAGAAFGRIRDQDTGPDRAVENAKVTFLAPGHGAPVAGCLAQVYPQDPMIAGVLDDLGDTTAFPLRALVVNDEQSREAMTHTSTAQPALYALAVALGERLIAWGVSPSRVLGHSVGAFAAACLAGSLDRRRGYELIAERGRLMEDTTEGGMLACQMELDVAEGIAAQTGLEIAVVNGPRNVVLSGTPSDLADGEAYLKSLGIRASRLPVSRAFHSRTMRPIAENFTRALLEARPLRPQAVTFLSDVDGCTDSPLDSETYWLHHALHRIDFRPAARQAADSDIVVELGPNYLLPLIAANAEGRRPLLQAALPPDATPAAMLEVAGQLWAAGAPLGAVGDYHGALPRLGTTIPATRSYPLEPRPAATGRAGEPGPPIPAHAGSDATARSGSGDVPGTTAAWADFLAGELSGRLGVVPEHLDRQTGLFDLGLTSVVANEMRESIGRRFGLQLRSTIVFEYPTIMLLAEHLITIRPPALGTGLTAENAPCLTGKPDQEPVTLAQDAAVHCGNNRSATDQVDVVGMACRLPGGAESIDQFWSLILRSDHVMDAPPASRWAGTATRDTHRSTDRSQHGGFLESDPAVFDADHFGISPREARSMDPQHRLLLETVHHALTDAGLSREGLRGQKAGVWIGLSTSDYVGLRPGADLPDPYAVTGNSPSLASGRIAHYLGIEGPAVTIDTACSSSLVACHQAVRALRAGDVDLAVVGGVNLMLAQQTFTALSHMGALSASGRCSTFGSTADGYARGEGCGVIILRRQDDHATAGPGVWASLLGTAVNHDGISAGLTVPNGAAQRRVIEAAIRDAGTTAEDIDYIEAHGTGTPLGDPIELEALSAVFDPGRNRPLFVGSVKSQIGHLEAGAGIAGLIKAILVASHRHVTTHPRDLTPTDKFGWSQTRLELARDHHVPGHGQVVCGVSSFGFSGTNAHVVVSGPRLKNAAARLPNPAAGAGHEPKLLLATAATKPEMTHKVETLLEELTDPGNTLQDLSERLSTGELDREHRFAAVAQDAEEAIRTIRARIGSGPDHGDTDDVLYETSTGPRQSVWLFSGIGSQWKGMYRHLSTDLLVRERLEEAEVILREQGQPPLRDDSWHRSGRQEHLHPALTAMQVALSGAVRVLAGAPDRVIGYSAGTLAALVDTSWLDLRSALELAAWRGRLVDAAAGTGATAACGLGPDLAVACFEQFGLDELVVASTTGPQNCTVSGPVRQLARLEDHCRSTGIWWMSISDLIPFHHPSLRRFVDGADQVPQVPWLPGSDTTVALASGSSLEEIRSNPTALTADLWRPADLATVAAELHASGHPHMLVEMAPQPTLGSALASWTVPRQANSTPAAVPGRNPSRQLRRAAARQWVTKTIRATGPSRPQQGPPLSGKRHWWEGETDNPTGSTATTAAGDGYRLRWQSMPHRPQRHGTSPDRWVLVADSGTPTGRWLPPAFTALGHDLEIRGWDDTSPGEAPAASKTGIIIDATEAPPLHTDLGWHRRLLALLQAWSAQNVELWVLTRGATTAGGAIDLGGASVWGIARALSVEIPQEWGGAIDLDPGTDQTEAEIARLAEEVVHGGTEDQVALRGRLRKVPRLHQLPEAAADEVTLDPEASYLVTGGSGTLGKRMVRWLAARGAQHIVVAARSDETTQRSRLADLSAQLLTTGTALHFVQADATDGDRIDAILSDAQQPWPAIRGVLHLAGHMSARPFQETTAEELLASWEAKAHGAEVLEEAARNHALDFVVLFSSASSVWGSAQAVPYVAANYGLDVIAHRASMEGLPFVSVNWSWWPDTAMAEGVHEYFRRMGLGPVGEDTGWAAMDRAVSAQETGLVVAPIDWTSFRPVMAARRPRPMFDSIGRAESPSARPSSVTATMSTQRGPWTRTKVENRLEASVKTVLGTEDRIEPTRGFFDMGIDSIMTLELKRDIESWSGQEFDDAFLFEHPRLADLADALCLILCNTSGGESSPETGREPPRAEPVDLELDELDSDALLAMLEQELGTSMGPGELHADR